MASPSASRFEEDRQRENRILKTRKEIIALIKAGDEKVRSRATAVVMKRGRDVLRRILRIPNTLGDGY